MEKARNAQDGDWQQSSAKRPSPCDQLRMWIGSKRRPGNLQRVQNHEGDRPAGEPGRERMAELVDNHESQPRESNKRDDEQNLKKTLHGFGWLWRWVKFADR